MRAERMPSSPVELSKSPLIGGRASGFGGRIRTCVIGFSARYPSARRPRSGVGGSSRNRTLPCRLRAGCSALELKTRGRSRSHGGTVRHWMEVVALWARRDSNPRSMA